MNVNINNNNENTKKTTLDGVFYYFTVTCCVPGRFLCFLLIFFLVIPASQSWSLFFLGFDVSFLWVRTSVCTSFDPLWLYIGVYIIRSSLTLYLFFPSYFCSLRTGSSQIESIIVCILCKIIVTLGVWVLTFLGSLILVVDLRKLCNSPVARF